MTDASKETAQGPAASLADALAERVVCHFALLSERRIVVGIGGESGSGKSVTARNLARALVAAGVASDVLHQDDYFVRPPRVNHAFRCLDLAHVGPHEVELGVLARHIEDFRAGRDDVAAPLVDYAGDQFVEQRLYFGRLRLLIVEGTYVLSLPGLDFRIFLEATHEETRERRRVRNRDLDEPVIDEILAIEHRIIAPQRLTADVVIDRDFRITAGETRSK